MYKTLSFYQFDGYRSYFPHLELPDTVHARGQALIRGVTQTGQLFGMVLSSGHVFLFDPDTYAIQFIPTEEDETLIQVIADEKDLLYVLTGNFRGQYVYKIENGQLLKIRKILRPDEETDHPTDVTTENCRLLIRDGVDLWFVDNFYNYRAQGIWQFTTPSGYSLVPCCDSRCESKSVSGDQCRWCDLQGTGYI